NPLLDSRSMQDVRLEHAMRMNNDGCLLLSRRPAYYPIRRCIQSLQVYESGGRYYGIGRTPEWNRQEHLRYAGSLIHTHVRRVDIGSHTASRHDHGFSALPA